MTALTPRQAARDLGLPLRLPHRRRRHSVTVAPSWDLLLGWAVDAYWERHGNHDQAA